MQSGMDYYCFFDNHYKPLSAATLPAISRAAMYGDGCFDTLRFDNGQILNLQAHIDRFIGGLEWLGIDVLPEEELLEIIETLLDKNRLWTSSAMVRLQCWRTGERGYKTDSQSRQFLAYAKPKPVFEKNVTLSTVNTRRVPSEAIPSKYKLSNGLNYIAASREAQQAGFDDAVMLTLSGHISETPIANIFWLDDEVLYTSSIDCDILPGTTRQFIIDVVAPSLGIKVEEVTVAKEELTKPDFVFTVNSLREITPVTQWDFWKWEPEEIRKRNAFWQAAFNECKLQHQTQIQQ